MRRITANDLPFVQTLMARPAMNAHKPDPTPPSPTKIAEHHARDLSHWRRCGFGRYVVSCNGQSIGLCGLTRPDPARPDGYSGLNLSYHLAPDHWGKGHASAMAPAMVDLARLHLCDQGHIFGLARPSQPSVCAGIG